jgi:hypothetical protein
MVLSGISPEYFAFGGGPETVSVESVCTNIWQGKIGSLWSDSLKHGPIVDHAIPFGKSIVYTEMLGKANLFKTSTGIALGDFSYSTLDDLSASMVGLLVLRIFKYFTIQPKMALVTRTVSHVFWDVGHLLVVLATMVAM